MLVCLCLCALVRVRVRERVRMRVRARVRVRVRVHVHARVGVRMHVHVRVRLQSIFQARIPMFVVRANPCILNKSEVSNLVVCFACDLTLQTLCLCFA